VYTKVLLSDTGEIGIWSSLVTAFLPGPVQVILSSTSIDAVAVHLSIKGSPTLTDFMLSLAVVVEYTIEKN